MTIEELIKELEALIEKAEGETLTEEESERMAELTQELNERTAANDAMNERMAQARAAIENGNANQIASAPRLRGMQFSGQIEETTDYSRYERTAYFKDLAQRSGFNFADGEMTREERAAFTHLTTNTGAVVPTETQNEIISLVDSSATIFGDVHRDTFPHIYEIPRHKAITAGDAAQTAEGAAPTDEEQNQFDTITINGDEIKKTVKMSRKMQITSIAAFEAYIVREIAARLAFAGENKIIALLDDTNLGMATANKITITGANAKLTKAKLVEALGKLKTFNNPASKGAIVYANGTTIWNQIAMVEDANNRSYFIQSEQTDDPTIQGRVFGKLVKQDDALTDNVILIGYPDLFRSNIFGDLSVDPYVEHGTQKRCWDGYMLYGGALAVPQAFAKITISASA